MEYLSARECMERGAAALMDRFKPSELPPVNRFHYHQGVFLAGVERVYALTGNRKYRDYIKAWVDINIDENGDCATYSDIMFDDIQPAVLLFGLYRETGDERYKKMLDRLYRDVELWPTSAKGGLWHKKNKDNQLWLDTMYMFGVFAARYAHEFGKPYMYERILQQAELMYRYMRNPETGLLYHMWDDSKQAAHTDADGLVRVHWGRANGWYAAALAEMIGILDEGSAVRERLIEIERAYLASVVKYQDKKSGLWYQVLDKGEDARNWTESSCTALFTYALAKCLNMGVIDASYRENALLGYRGVMSKTEIKDGALLMNDICVGTGVGEEEYYFKRPVSQNDLHGVGALLLMASEIYTQEK